MESTQQTNAGLWPALPLAKWSDTYHTLHMWTQIVGKVRLALSPHINHWWEVPLYVSARGLNTSPIPYGNGIFEVEFDFLDHDLTIKTNRGELKRIGLYPRSVADFYQEFMRTLSSLGFEVKIWHMPVEIPDPIPFDQDQQHASYDPVYANAFWRVLVPVDEVLKEFRGNFICKSSPVHFFWGSFDMAVTRFSGRRAPERPGADSITREAYSHEVISAGWWPGGSGIDGPAFYCYAAPEPLGLPQQKVQPDSAFYHPDLKEFILMYDEIRKSRAPEPMLLEFLQSTYEAAAAPAHWGRGGV